MTRSTKRTIYVALAANVAIAVCKGAAGAVSGSSVMLAEAAHSVADTANQIFLRVSLALGEREADREHPFGHGKERFFWAFLAAVFIFVSGAVFSIGRGVLSLVSGGGEGGGYVLSYGVLAFALVAEGASLVRVHRQLREEAGRRDLPLLRFVETSTDPTTKTVLFEDSAAVAGVLLAFGGVGLHQLTGSAVPDAAASIAVGALLAGVALRIGLDSRRLLLGLGAAPNDLDAIGKAVRARPEVKELLDLRTMYVGPNRLLVAVRVDFVEGIDADQVELAAEELRRELRRAAPEARDVFVDAGRR